jgi:hypothetical protein
MLPVKVPGIEKWPDSSVIAIVPALEPSMTSTLQAARGLVAVSLTAPDSRKSCNASGTGGGVACTEGVGSEDSEQATEDARASAANQRIGCTIPVVCPLDPARGGPTSLSGFFRFS